MQDTEKENNYLIQIIIAKSHQFSLSENVLDMHVVDYQVNVLVKIKTWTNSS